MAAEQWSEHASMYGDVFHAMTEIFADPMIKLAFARRGCDGARVLEVACGTGALTVPLARHLALSGRLEAEDDLTDIIEPQLWATDFSGGMVAATMDLVRRHGLRNVLGGVRDGMDLRFDDPADDPFGAVFSMFGMFLFPDRKRGWREARQVLAPGGVLCVSSWNVESDDPSSWFEMTFKVLVKQLVALTGKPPPKRDGDDMFAVSKPAVLVAELRAIGFDDVTNHVVNQTAVVSPAKLATFMLDSPIIKAMTAALSVDQIDSVRDAVIASLVAARDQSPTANQAKIGDPDEPMCLLMTANVCLGVKSAKKSAGTNSTNKRKR